MQKIIAMIVCWCWFWPVSAQSNITAAEYFLDTDPGFGNATSILISSPSPNIIDNTFSVGLGAVPGGVHFLFIRSKDANGKWSISNRFVFYKPSSSAGAPAMNIVKAEYFFDTDPGFGNATDIPVTPGVDVENVNFGADISALAVGVHSLFIRSKNADGRWSITNRQILYKPNGNTALPPTNILKAEYFFDTDPGFGNATDIPVTPGIDVQNVNFGADISALTIGVHSLYIRSKNAEGKWSITNRQILYKPNGNAALPPVNIVKAEYFFDADPGFGNATDIPVTPGIDVQNVNFATDISSLTIGVHQLFIRSKDANDKWSVTNRQILYKPDGSSTAPANIVKAEYFFDTDPGFGNATDIPFTAGLDVQNLSFTVPINSLTAGIHNLYLRSKNGDGQWSVSNRQILYKPAASSAPANIVKAEYFFGTDPGFGNAINIPLTPGVNLQNVTFNTAMTGNKMFLRTKNADGKWSITNQVTLYQFTGNGNWDTASNWVGNIVGPNNVPTGTQVIINPSGTCIQTGAITTQPSSTIAVTSGKILTLNGSVNNAGTIEGGGTLNLAAGSSTFTSTGAITTPLVLSAKQMILTNDYTAGPISLTNGSNIQLGNFNLTMDTYSLNADNTNFVITNGTGTLNRTVGSAPVTFPVGLNSSSYSPTTISNGNVTGDFNVRVAQGVLTRPTVSPVTSTAVNRTWVISKSGATSSNLKLTMQWSGGDEQTGFDRNSCFVAGVCPPPPNCADGYDITTSAAATGTNPYTISRDSITNFNSSDSFIVRTIPPTVIYTFTGNGSWTNSSNWVNNAVPSNTIRYYMEVIIDPSSGSCTYPGNLIIQPGGKLTVQPGKILNITGNIIVQQ